MFLSLNVYCATRMRSCALSMSSTIVIACRTAIAHRLVRALADVAVRIGEQHFDAAILGEAVGLASAAGTRGRIVAARAAPAGQISAIAKPRLNRRMEAPLARILWADVRYFLPGSDHDPPCPSITSLPVLRSDDLRVRERQRLRPAMANAKARSATTSRRRTGRSPRVRGDPRQRPAHHRSLRFARALCRALSPVSVRVIVIVAPGTAPLAGSTIVPDNDFDCGRITHIRARNPEFAEYTLSYHPCRQGFAQTSRPKSSRWL